MSKHIRNILGLISEKNIYVDNKNQFTFPYPASLNNGLPSALYVYTDICEPYITGDSQSPLLRTFRRLGGKRLQLGVARKKVTTRLCA